MASGSLRRAYLKAQLAVREVVALSPRTMWAITANSVRMQRLDATARRRARADGRAAPSDAGTFTGAASDGTGRGLAVTFERATLHVTAVADDVVRLAWGPGPAPLDVATRDSTLHGPTTVDVEVDDAVGASLRTPSVRVTVDGAGVRILDASGTVRYCELPPIAQGDRRVLRRVLRDAERLCGLGEQARSLDLTGSSYRLWNRDPGGSWGTGQDPLYCSIPVTVGLHPTGAVWAFHETTCDATVVVGRVAHAAHGVEATFEGGSLVTYVAVGELDVLLNRAASLIGAPSMPPRWALGYHHCRWGWRSDDAVRAVHDGFAARGIPVSALHLDIDHMDEFRIFTFSPTRFAGVDALAHDARASGTRLVAIVDPAVRRDEGFSLYAQGVEGGHFVTDPHGGVHHGTVWPGWAAFPDFTRPATRSWWGSHYDELTSHGIAGVWHDMNEPTSITLWGDRTLPLDARFDLEGRGGTHREAHNVYGLLMDKAGFDALGSNETRPFIVSRAGWAGLQRYAWHWTADVESSSAGLAQQSTTFLGLGLSSVAFTGSDIGGFSGIPSAALYVRWLELGVVSPFCRTHCVLGAPDREPWRFDPPYDAAIQRLIRLRYRLVPHLYALAEAAHRTGAPLLRPLDWPARGRATGHTASADAMLLGDDLVVVPVADPDAAQVTVALPEGRWRRRRLCDAADGTVRAEGDVAGGTPVTLDAPLGQPVVLQRAGSIVVLDDGWCDDGARLTETHAAICWTLHVVLDDAGHADGDCFDDAGDGMGESRSDHYEAARVDGRTRITWRTDGTFPKPARTGVVVHGMLAAAAWVDGRGCPVSRVDGATHITIDGSFDVLEVA